MTDTRILVADMADVASILEDARDSDIQEVAASSGRELRDVLIEGIERSRVAWTGFVEGVPVAIFGVAPVDDLPGVGVPWMIGTNTLEDYATVFLRQSKNVLDQMRQLFPVLINYVDARNATAVRWLTWMGFNVHPAEPYGDAGLPFHRFDLGVPDV